MQNIDTIYGNIFTKKHRFLLENILAGGDTMSKIYDYEEYQNQRVKVTYTDKRKYREEKHYWSVWTSY